MGTSETPIILEALKQANKILLATWLEKPLLFPIYGNILCKECFLIEVPALRGNPLFLEAIELSPPLFFLFNNSDKLSKPGLMSHMDKTPDFDILIS